MSVTLRITHDLWMTFDGIGIYRFAASAAVIASAVGIALAARALRPGLMICLVWIWTLACVGIALLPWSADWWWHRVLIVGGAFVAGRALGMRVRGGEAYT